MPDDVLAVAARHVVARASTTSAADRQRAAVCVAHHLCCSLAGRNLPWSRAAISTVADRQPAVGATVLGTPIRTSPGSAILTNAVLGQSTLAEDVHPASLIHAGSIVVPVALAVAEVHGGTGRQFLNSIVAGYDVLCRVGTGMKTPAFVSRGFRPSGVFGPLGAAAAAAALLGLDEQTTASALGIAANTAAGLREWANGGSNDIYLQNGFAARNGYDAAVLATRGFTGPPGALTGTAGMGIAYSGGEVDWAAVCHAFAGDSAVTEVQFKRFPACSGVQTVLELAVAMRREHRPDPTQIEQIEIRTHRHGKRNPGCDNPGPWVDLGQAQMSNQLGVALALCGTTMDVADFQRYDEVGLRELAARVTVIEDDALTARYPAHSGAAMRIQLFHGDVLTGSLEEESGLSPAEVEQKFAAMVDATYPEAAARRARTAMAAIESAASVGELTAALREI